MMTQAQYQRLPHLARAIVDFDREMAAERTKPVSDIKFYRELCTRRGELARAADKIWGVPLKGGSATRS